MNWMRKYNAELLAEGVCLYPLADSSPQANHSWLVWQYMLIRTADIVKAFEAAQLLARAARTSLQVSEVAFRKEFVSRAKRARAGNLQFLR